MGHCLSATYRIRLSKVLFRAEYDSQRFRVSQRSKLVFLGSDPKDKREAIIKQERGLIKIVTKDSSGRSIWNAKKKDQCSGVRNAAVAGI